MFRETKTCKCLFQKDIWENKFRTEDKCLKTRVGSYTEYTVFTGLEVIFLTSPYFLVPPGVDQA